jgi:hypothetical protein
MKNFLNKFTTNNSVLKEVMNNLNYEDILKNPYILIEYVSLEINSTIITSQLPVSSWYNYLNNDTVADAILDRIIHSSHRIELEGESMRKIRSKINKI